MNEEKSLYVIMKLGILVCKGFKYIRINVKK